jgi:lipid-binding SYLF domain-containing protein
MNAKTWAGFLGLAVLVAGGPGEALAQKKDPEITVAKSLQVLSEITRNPKTGMPRLVLRKAQGIAIIPDMFKAGFIVGARFGRGVLVVKQPDGTWSNPVFIHQFGGSFGAQAGAQSTDLVLVFQSQKGIDRFLKGKDKLTLGVDVAAAAGPAGKRFEASTDLALKAEILSYSNTRGVFAGVSAEGGTLQVDWRSNNLYYSQPAAPAAILAVNSPLPVPPSTISLKQMLAEKTAWPERVVRSGRPRTGVVIIEDDVPSFEGPDGIELDSKVRSEPLPGPAPSRPRTSTSPRVESRPTAVPELGPDDDIDFIPSGKSPKKAPRRVKPAPANDEDLPEAMPEPAPARTRPKAAKPKPEPRPSAEPGDPDDDLPDLEAPRAGNTRPGA